MPPIIDDTNNAFRLAFDSDWREVIPPGGVRGVVSAAIAALLAVRSVITGLVGAIRLTNIVIMSQTDYDNRAILPDDATTLFIVL